VRRGGGAGAPRPAGSRRGSGAAEDPAGAVCATANAWGSPRDVLQRPSVPAIPRTHVRSHSGDTLSRPAGPLELVSERDRRASGGSRKSGPGLAPPETQTPGPGQRSVIHRGRSPGGRRGQLCSHAVGRLANSPRRRIRPAVRSPAPPCPRPAVTCRWVSRHRRHRLADVRPAGHGGSGRQDTLCPHPKRIPPRPYLCLGPKRAPQYDYPPYQTGGMVGERTKLARGTRATFSHCRRGQRPDNRDQSLRRPAHVPGRVAVETTERTVSVTEKSGDTGGISQSGENQR
jgi:hypothetical protein